MSRLDYPPARRGSVVDEYHGTKVPDPYRWLEDPTSEETLAFVRAQNEVTDGYIRGHGSFDAVRQLLERRWDYEKYGVPRCYGSRLFYFKNDGLQNQSVLYVRDERSGESRVVIDPNTFSQDGTVALTAWSCCHDGSVLVYGSSCSGSDWQTLHILAVDGGVEYEETIHDCRWPSIAWNGDGSGFFYKRYPEEGAVAEEERVNFGRVYFHRLGTSQSADELVWERPEDKTMTPYCATTNDSQFLVLHLGRNCDPKNRVYVRSLQRDDDWLKLVDDEHYGYHLVGNRGSRLYFHSDVDAPRWKIVSCRIDGMEHDGSWQEVVAEGAGVLDTACLTAEGLVVSHEVDAHHELSVYDDDGVHQRTIALPALGSVFGLWGREDLSVVYFGFTSFLHPMRIYRYDIVGDALTVLFEPQVDFDAERYETRQVFYPSKDGTKVPLFITCRKDIVLDGTSPTLLYGYGGFAVSLTPGFGVPCSVWLELGGVYAVANLRGGNEYGREWHEGGKLANKQNVFDDFAAAAEYLIAEGYTTADRLASWGGSNGGLLTAATMLQRPELFGAVISSVPVIDMLRFHKFTCGRFWVSDYGDAEGNAEHFAFMYAYSPLHNVEQGRRYPPLLVMTADTDDRVVPAHGKKFIAEMQYRTDGSNPALLRVETKAGHGFGKPTSKRIEERAYMMAFLCKTFAVTVPPPEDVSGS